MSGTPARAPFALVTLRQHRAPHRLATERTRRRVDVVLDGERRGHVMLTPSELAAIEALLRHGCHASALQVRLSVHRATPTRDEVPCASAPPPLR